MPIGHWSARFAEGARVTVFSDTKQFRGTILPLKASGHTYNDEVDTQPSAWTNLELRIDAKTDIGRRDARARHQSRRHGFDRRPARIHQDRLHRLASSRRQGRRCRDVRRRARGAAAPRLRCRSTAILLFTLSEEIGVGASAVLHGEVSELVAVDNGTIAPGQNTSTYGVTIAMQDSSGPFDWHLTRNLHQARARQQDRAHPRRFPLFTARTGRRRSRPATTSAPPWFASVSTPATAGSAPTRIRSPRSPGC